MLRLLREFHNVDLQGNVVKEAGSVLPEPILSRIYELSYEFMDYPDDIEQLGMSYYGRLIADDTGTEKAAKLTLLRTLWIRG